MTDHALASFEAKDGTGRWEVFTWGIIANGQRYHFTKQSHIVCAGLPGRTEKHVYQTETASGCGRRLPSTKRPAALPTRGSLPGLWAVRALKHTSTRGRSPAT